MINGQVVTIFGISPASIITGRGIPWLVSTDLMEQQPLTFLRHCRPVLRDMSRGYRSLKITSMRVTTRLNPGFTGWVFAWRTLSHTD
jgi:hypothetical protein